jgi:hypothetical protein
MTGSLAIYPPAEGATLRLHLEDRGQDFLWWDVKPYRSNMHIVVGCGPFQGWMWEGTRISRRTMRVGHRLRIKKKREGAVWITLNYPVTRIEPLSAKRIKARERAAKKAA